MSFERTTTPIQGQLTSRRHLPKSLRRYCEATRSIYMRATWWRVIHHAIWHILSITAKNRKQSLDTYHDILKYQNISLFILWRLNDRELAGWAFGFFSLPTRHLAGWASNMAHVLANTTRKLPWLWIRLQIICILLPLGPLTFIHHFNHRCFEVGKWKRPKACIKYRLNIE